MTLHSYSLVGAGLFSMLIALLHVYLAIRPEVYRYFGAVELVELYEQGSSFTVLVRVGLAAMFAVWGLYAISGGGLLSPFPWAKTVLLGIGIIYVLRGLMLPTDIIKSIGSAAPLRFIILSAGSLIIGLLHIYGTLGLPRS